MRLDSFVRVAILLIFAVVVVAWLASVLNRPNRPLRVINGQQHAQTAIDRASDTFRGPFFCYNYIQCT
jgi:hypothetical protein